MIFGIPAISISHASQLLGTCETKMVPLGSGQAQLLFLVEQWVAFQQRDNASLAAEEIISREQMLRQFLHRNV